MKISFEDTPHGSEINKTDIPDSWFGEAVEFCRKHQITIERHGLDYYFTAKNGNICVMTYDSIRHPDHVISRLQEVFWL